MESTQTLQTNSFTDEEKALAERYQVEPKLCRLIADIVSGHTEPEAVETEEQPAGLDIDRQTQERIKAYYKNMSSDTKLAIVTFSEMRTLDGINFQARKKEGKFVDGILADLQSTCLEEYHTDPDSTIDKEDIWLAGIWQACRMVLQNC